MTMPGKIVRASGVAILPVAGGLGALLHCQRSNQSAMIVSIGPRTS